MILGHKEKITFRKKSMLKGKYIKQKTQILKGENPIDLPSLCTNCLLYRVLRHKHMVSLIDSPGKRGFNLLYVKVVAKKINID